MRRLGREGVAGRGISAWRNGFEREGHGEQTCPVGPAKEKLLA
jgi:hypothetical protein